MMNRVLNEIQSDIDWRLKQLKEYEGIVLKLSDEQSKIVLQSFIPMTYAHWEGFVISSIKVTSKHLNELDLSNEDYCCTYLTVAYEKTLGNLESSTNFDTRKSHLTNLYVEFNQKVILPLRINTKSNLKFNVLEEICKKYNLNIENFTEYKSAMNELINVRNSIVHGENSHSFEKYSDVEKYVDLLENLMSDFLNEIQALLKYKKYGREAI